MTPETLVRMANQIAGYFASMPHDEAVTGIVGHIRSFWDPRMRHQLLTVAGKPGSGLEPLALDAIARLEPVTV